MSTTKRDDVPASRVLLEALVAAAAGAVLLHLLGEGVPYSLLLGVAVGAGYAGTHYLTR